MTRDRKRSESVRDYPWEQWPPNRCLHSSDYGSKVDGRLDWADLLDRCVHGVTDGYKPKLMYYVVSGIWREDRQRLNLSVSRCHWPTVALPAGAETSSLCLACTSSHRPTGGSTGQRPDPPSKAFIDASLSTDEIDETFFISQGPSLWDIELTGEAIRIIWAPAVAAVWSIVAAYQVDGLGLQMSIERYALFYVSLEIGFDLTLSQSVDIKHAASC
ncbi:hypothetical protein RRG08_037614 [Elysia crispata]|uniref:Uncharacterized protein n=1 Tax=Elysia crispata TaxID=231223 RepID=A0AAE0YGX1_9GAST|nr:hypothetical protein RRG08_037614 [Elysia crispata]